MEKSFVSFAYLGNDTEADSRFSNSNYVLLKEQGPNFLFR